MSSFYSYDLNKRIGYPLSTHPYTPRSTPLSYVLQLALDTLDRGGMIKISNHTHVWPAVLGMDPECPNKSSICGAPWRPPFPKIPPFYVYVKHPSFPIWEEYDGYPKQCKRQVVTMNQSSSVHARMTSRIRAHEAYRVVMENPDGTVIANIDTKIIDFGG